MVFVSVLVDMYSSLLQNLVYRLHSFLSDARLAQLSTPISDVLALPIARIVGSIFGLFIIVCQLFLACTVSMFSSFESVSFTFS